RQLSLSIDCNAVRDPLDVNLPRVGERQEVPRLIRGCRLVGIRPSIRSDGRVWLPAKARQSVWGVDPLPGVIKRSPKLGFVRDRSGILAPLVIGRREGVARPIIGSQRDLKAHMLTER